MRVHGGALPTGQCLQPLSPLHSLHLSAAQQSPQDSPFVLAHSDLHFGIRRENTRICGLPNHRSLDSTRICPRGSLFQLSFGDSSSFQRELRGCLCCKASLRAGWAWIYPLPRCSDTVLAAVREGVSFLAVPPLVAIFKGNQKKRFHHFEGLKQKKPAHPAFKCGLSPNGL